MSGLEELFSQPALSKEQMEIDSVFDGITLLLTDLCNESKQRNGYTCDDVSEILLHLRLNYNSRPTMQNILEYLADALTQAQHSMQRSIEEQLDVLLASQLPIVERFVLIAIKKEPKLFDWIKTTSI